jgi:hypothetical protein
MNYTTVQKKCDVCITTGRNRLKVYEQINSPSVVFLKDGQKFEIELFNPHGHKVLAKIKMNGHYISSSGIVINPGQRIYLERYLDSNNAFVFSTYEVDGTVEALKAISENGNLSVEFFAEEIQAPLTNPVWVHPDYYTYWTSPYCGTTNYGATYTAQTTNISCSVSGSSSFLSCDPVETGRVEKGEKTSQGFTHSNDSFYFLPFETFSLKLLPQSAKPTEVKEIRNYCTECGTRMKKATWKFCPNCGSKI